MRLAVVTPYFNESTEVLQRCMASVRSQTVSVGHILVADGNPQYRIEAHADVTHVVLRQRAADFGDTPRCLGFVLGIRSEYDIIQSLDADNVLTPDHFAVTLEHFLGRSTTEYPDVVVARRQMLRPDGSILTSSPPEEHAFRHVDTNCYVFYRTAFPFALKWSLIPRQLSFIDDRVFFAMLTRTHADLKLAFNRARTSDTRVFGSPFTGCSARSRPRTAKAWVRAMPPRGIGGALSIPTASRSSSARSACLSCSPRPPRCSDPDARANAAARVSTQRPPPERGRARRRCLNASPALNKSELLCILPMCGDMARRVRKRPSEDRHPGGAAAPPWARGALRRAGAATAAAIMLLCAALAACDSRPSADGSATGNGGRGHVKVGIPF
ncbi:MAG: hypothetical protein ACM3O6_12890 [Acidobacteriota bacterium]